MQNSLSAVMPEESNQDSFVLLLNIAFTYISMYIISKRPLTQ